MDLADKKKCPQYSTAEFQMESDIKPGELLLKWGDMSSLCSLGV